jgi:signal transduction histidine kinase
MNIGNIYYHQGLYEKALLNYQIALKETVNHNISDIMPKLYNNIGTVMMDLNNYQEGLKYFKKSLKEKIKLNDMPGIANCLSNIGSVYTRLSDYKLAVGYYKKALKLFREQEAAHYVAITCFNIGASYNSLQEYKKALTFMEESVFLSRKYNLKDSKQQSFIMIANIHENLDELDKAQYYYDQYIKDIDDIADTKNKLYLYKKYANFCKRTGKLELALEYSEKLLETSTNMFNDDLAKNIASIKSTLDYEQKKFEAQIYELKIVELLKKQNEIEMQKDELQHLNNSKDTIMSIVSHDLKNSIGSIQTIMELIKNENMSPKLKKYFDIIESQSEKALNLVRDILDANRIEMDNYSLNLEKTNLNQILASYEKSLKELAHIKNINFSFSFSDQEIYCMINSEKFWQIIFNLSSNAIKFSDQNSDIRITSELCKIKDINYVKINVIDQGIGIEDEQKDFIFDKFSKASKKGTMGEESTGLGLSIVKRLVHLHNGVIDFKSEPGKGSTFSVFLPVLQ